MTIFIDRDSQVKEGVRIFPLSLAQQRLWFFDQLAPHNTIYNVISSLRLQVSLDVNVFKHSLDVVMQRHEVLRTAITEIKGQPQQIVHPSLALSLPIVELQHLSERERETQILRLATEEAQRPFDLGQVSLIRTSLLKLGDEDYLLLLSMHSIISDAWSIGLFYQELAVLYEAFLNGQPSPLAPLPIQYTDYTRWQEEWLQGNELAEQVAYWKKQLENASSVLELPIDHPRPSIQTYRGAAQQFVLSKSLTDALKSLSSREEVSLYMTLVAVFQILLHRYTSQDNIVIGTPVAGRTQSEIESLIGPFTNTLVLRTNLSGNPTFHELLKRVREVILDAQAHQDVPFEYLVEELHIERNVAQSPLFQAMLSLEPSSPTLPPGWTLTQLHIETSTSKFDLSLALDDQPEGLIGRFEYSTDLFDAETIHRMVGHWQMLLEGIVADIGQQIGMLPLLTEAERHQQLVEWNPIDAEYPKDKCVHQLFEAQVERTPDAVAVVFEDKSLTYRELNRKANQLAHYLQQLGVGPEVLVGIYVERSLEMIVGILGIFKAGGAYVPLDPAYPQERQAFKLADTQTKVMLTQQQLVEKLPPYEGCVICMDTDWKKIAQESEENPTSAVTAESLAYVMYTSGSTGKPKGVLASHEIVVRLFEATYHWFHFDHHDVWTLFHSYESDFTTWELWGALLYGGRVVIVSHWTSRSPEAFYNLLRTEQVTVLNQTPSAFYQLIRGEESCGTADDLALRVVVFGGEVLEFQNLKPWFERHGDQSPQLINMYGITETTTHVTYYPVSAADLERTTGSVIGRPMPDLQVYILDQYQQLVPIGVLGEMYIGGAGLARGYLNRLELTAERFISNPFSQKSNARLYKSRDLARYLPDGNMESLGRIDDLVKLRGYSIEPAEIEAVLSQHPTVDQAVVVAREDVPGDKRLVAYIVPAQGQPPVIKDLRSYLKEKLPIYMVPSAFMLLNTLPLTPNGKVDKRALPIPQQTERAAEETYAAPTSIVHYQLIQIWEELLDARPIGIRDNFFDLGGHSFLAARLVTSMEQVFSQKIPLATLFAGPTIGQLANALQTEEKEEFSRTPIVAVQTGTSKRPLFYLHGDWTGGAFYCFHLARELGADQPFYALEPYRFDDLAIPPTFETMATAHIQSIRAIQPEGPYLLAGWCNGGLMAYEIAQQLQAAGQKVDLLVLMDPMYLGYRARRRMLRLVINHLGNLIGLSQDKQLDWFLRLFHVYKPLRSMMYALLHRYTRLRDVRYGSLQESIRLLSADMINVAQQKVTIGIQSFTRMFQRERVTPLHIDSHVSTSEAIRQDYPDILEWQDMGYMPSSIYPGKITFFWPSEEPWHTASWHKVVEAKDAKEVEVHIIPGNQDTWRNEHLHTLAEHLRMCLGKAQKEMICSS